MPRLRRDVDTKVMSDFQKDGIAADGIEIVRRGMKKAVNEPGGSARSARVAGIVIAGKSGTAQILRNGKKETIGWFIGFAPYDRPEIALCVMLEGEVGQCERRADREPHPGTVAEGKRFRYDRASGCRGEEAAHTAAVITPRFESRTARRRRSACSNEHANQSIEVAGNPIGCASCSVPRLENFQKTGAEISDFPGILEKTKSFWALTRGTPTFPLRRGVRSREFAKS